jgi:excisionase family DNA binding protein
MPDKERKLLTIPEAAKVVGVTRAVLWRYVKADRLPTIQAGRFYLIDEEEAIRFRNRERHPGRPRGSKNRPPPAQ